MKSPPGIWNEEPSVVIADVAAERGDADQAHLNRDVRTVWGLTPRHYRRGQQPSSRRGFSQSTLRIHSSPRPQSASTWIWWA